MPHRCKCGGRFRRTDIIADGFNKRGQQMYRDTSTTVATFQCSSCGDVRTQRKRQPKIHTGLTVR